MPTENTVTVGAQPLENFPDLKTLEDGQMFTKPNGTEIYMSVGSSSTMLSWLYIQLKNGHRHWVKHDTPCPVKPLTVGTKVHITQGE